MKTFWLLTLNKDTGRIVPDKVKKHEGTKKSVESARAEYAKMVPDLMIVVESETIARMYASYSQFPDNLA